MPKIKASSQHGQVGLIVLLVMVVMLTLGISIIFRGSLDVSQSRQEEETSRIFDAAEAGIEDALGYDFSTLGPGVYADQITNIDGIDVDYTISSIAELETFITQGHTVAVDLTGAVDGNTLIVEWEKDPGCASDTAALVIAIFKQDANTTVRREAVRPIGCDKGDNFTIAAAGTSPYQASHTITLQNNDVVARIRPLYGDSDIKVIAGVGWTLPIQYYQINSVAQRDTTGDFREVRVVEVKRTIPAAPSVFDYVLFSDTTLVK